MKRKITKLFTTVNFSDRSVEIKLTKLLMSVNHKFSDRSMVRKITKITEKFLDRSMVRKIR